MTSGWLRSVSRLVGSGGLLAGFVTISACFTGQVSDPYSGPIIPPNLCTSADAALTLTDCMLTLGQWKQSYISQPQEQTWYSAAVGTLNQLSVVHVQAGYYLDGGTLPDGGIPDGGYGGCTSANNTAVNLTLIVLDQDALTGVTSASDIHGTACPTPMDITFTYTQSNTSLLLILQDDAQKKFDTKNKYSVMVDVLQNPDTNEPNDTPATATPIQLTSGSGGTFSGQSGGYLATPGDVDYFTVQSPGANTVLWLELSQDPSVPSPPPHKYRLQYYVYAPDGTTQVSEGDAPAGSQYSAKLVTIGTAILLNQVGPYYIKVMGYRDSNSPNAPDPGDLTFKYLLKTILVPLQDVPEGTAPPYNNSFATAYPVNGGAPIAVGSSTTVTGRTSYVGDADWYSVTLAPSANLALLHYKLTPGATGGRFPALPTNPSRQLFVYTQTPDQPSCLYPDAGLCLISAPGGSTAAAIAQGSCQETPPKCLQSYRVEALPEPNGGILLANLKNFESNLQIPPHAAAVTYYFYLQASGDPYANNGYWADDKDYSIVFEHKLEPDALEAIPDPPRPTTLAAAPSLLVGGPVYLSYGLGKFNPNDQNASAKVIFGPEDYDGRGDDIDTYQVALPFTTEQAWQISWSVPVSANGMDPDYDLGITLSFCDNTPDAGTGTPPCYAMVSTRQSDGSQLGLAYSNATYDSWWNLRASVIPDEVVFTQTVSGGVVTTTVTPYNCSCFEPRFVASGTSYFLMNIFPLNRMSWDLVPYTVTTSYSAYPYAFTNAAGGSTTCPATCGFTLH